MSAGELDPFLVAKAEARSASILARRSNERAKDALNGLNDWKDDASDLLPPAVMTKLLVLLSRLYRSRLDAEPALTRLVDAAERVASTRAQRRSSENSGQSASAQETSRPLSRGDPHSGIASGSAEEQPAPADVLGEHKAKLVSQRKHIADLNRRLTGAHNLIKSHSSTRSSLAAHRWGSLARQLFERVRRKRARRHLWLVMRDQQNEIRELESEVEDVLRHLRGADKAHERSTKSLLAEIEGQENRINELRSEVARLQSEMAATGATVAVAHSPKQATTDSSSMQALSPSVSFLSTATPSLEVQSSQMTRKRLSGLGGWASATAAGSALLSRRRARRARKSAKREAGLGQDWKDEVEATSSDPPTSVSMASLSFEDVLASDRMAYDRGDVLEMLSAHRERVEETRVANEHQIARVKRDAEASVAKVRDELRKERERNRENTERLRAELTQRK